MAEDFCRIGRSATRTATFQRLTTTNVFNETRLRLAKQFFWNSFFAQRRYIILPALLRIRNCEVVFSFSFTFVVIDATRIKECFRECEDIMRKRRELWTWTGNCRNVETFPLVWTNRLVDNGAHKHNLETALVTSVTAILPSNKSLKFLRGIHSRYRFFEIYISTLISRDN